MAKVYFIYSNSRLPLSPIIRKRTGSRYSHIGIILKRRKDSITRDSLVTHAALSCKGVRFTTVKTFIAHASEYIIKELDADITIEQFELLVYFAKFYEGLKYDLKGAIGLGVGENWQEDDAFWCSEWVAFLLKSIGMELKYLNNTHRIHVGHCFEWPQETILLDLS